MKGKVGLSLSIWAPIMIMIQFRLHQRKRGREVGEGGLITQMPISQVITWGMLKAAVQWKDRLSRAVITVPAVPPGSGSGSMGRAAGRPGWVRTPGSMRDRAQGTWSWVSVVYLHLRSFGTFSVAPQGCVCSSFAPATLASASPAAFWEHANIAIATRNPFKMKYLSRWDKAVKKRDL